jgi:sigma-E factor negative regulatory protein RseC
VSGFDDNATEDIGKVIQVSGSHAKVEIQRGGGCGSCAMRGFCFKKGEPAVFDVQTELPLKEGDLVSLEIAPSVRVLSALLVFGLPLSLLFIAFIVASLYFTELVSVLLAFGAMALSFAIVGCLDRRFGKNMKISVGGIHDHKAQ